MLEFRDKKSTFSTRLGFIGVNFAEYGTITFGKLNSVYKDVAGTTDIFNVMSGQESYVYSPTGLMQERPEPVGMKEHWYIKILFGNLMLVYKHKWEPMAEIIFLKTIVPQVSNKSTSQNHHQNNKILEKSLL